MNEEVITYTVEEQEEARLIYQQLVGLSQHDVHGEGMYAGNTQYGLHTIDTGTTTFDFEIVTKMYAYSSQSVMIQADSYEEAEKRFKELFMEHKGRFAHMNVEDVYVDTDETDVSVSSIVPLEDNRGEPTITAFVEGKLIIDNREFTELEL